MLLKVSFYVSSLIQSILIICFFLKPEAVINYKEVILLVKKDSIFFIIT